MELLESRGGFGDEQEGRRKGVGKREKEHGPAEEEGRHADPGEEKR